MPPSFFDSHCHIINPYFPLTSNNGYLPNAFTTSNYLSQLKKILPNYQCIGGCIVSGSFQGHDSMYLKHALKIINANKSKKFVGVINSNSKLSDQEIIQLNKSGVRGIRFNAYRGGSENLVELHHLAKRVRQIAQWHVEIYIDSKNINNHITNLLLNNHKICIDHLGLSKEGLPKLLKFVELGGYVKATGFSRGNINITQAIKQIININPKALMFGTDLPCTRAPKCFSAEDVNLLLDAVPAAQHQNILVENALHFYRLSNE